MANKNVNQLENLTSDSNTNKNEGARKVEKNPAAVALGRLGGLKGGKARADSLTPERRKEIAIKAAEKRWTKMK